MPDAPNINGRAGLGWGESEPPRLTPAMASMRLLVLDFVRRYIGRWKASPSYGEIAEALGTNRTRVRKAVKSLESEGLLLRSPGPRGLAMPSERQAALRVLRMLGWHVDERAEAVTNRPLRLSPALSYRAPRTDGDGNGGTEAQGGD